MATKKRFFLTSEFWITALTTVGAIGASVVGLVPAAIAGTIAAVSTGAYAIARGLTKGGTK